MNTETTTTRTYDAEREGHPMGERAETVDALLFDAVGEYVHKDTLAEKSGLSLASVSWRVFQLRCQGWVIEASGENSYRLVDMAPVSEEERLARGAQKLVFTRGRKVLGGRAVFHAEFGEGRVTFEREGFPSLKVAFEHGEEKVSRGDVIEA